MTACDLCEAAVITTRYLEDDLCWVADCEICAVPMVVWRTHGAAPDETTRSALLARLSFVADAALGEGAWRVDDHMRNIPDHYHAHARVRPAWLEG